MFSTAGAPGCGNSPTNGPGAAVNNKAHVDGSPEARLDASAGDEILSSVDARAPVDGAGADEDGAEGWLDGSVDAAGACSAQATGTTARSTGYAGTSAPYFALFDSTPCSVPSDCVPACTSAGGTMASCAMGSLCQPDFCPDGGTGCLECLPPTYWLDTAGALGQPGSGASGSAANDIQAFDNGYNDTLEVTSFPLNLPSGAIIVGVLFTVDRKATDSNAKDAAIRILKAGAPVGADHADASTWSQAYGPIAYGGPDDTWGETWTAGDVLGPNFGIAITPEHLSTSGNDTVYVDSVSVTVFYTGAPGCP
ncbi:MAG: hypothetical protein ACLP1X_30555 [Polyangiaceae bacterium]